MHELPSWKKFLTDFSNPQSSIPNPQSLIRKKSIPWKFQTDRPVYQIFTIFFGVFIRKLYFVDMLIDFFIENHRHYVNLFEKYVLFFIFEEKWQIIYLKFIETNRICSFCFGPTFHANPQSSILNPQSPIWFDRPTFLPTFSS